MGDLLDVAAWDKYDKYNNLFYSCSIRTKNANQKQNMDNFIENMYLIHPVIQITLGQHIILMIMS